MPVRPARATPLRRTTHNVATETLMTKLHHDKDAREGEASSTVTREARAGACREQAAGPNLPALPNDRDALRRPEEALDARESLSQSKKSPAAPIN